MEVVCRMRSLFSLLVRIASGGRSKKTRTGNRKSFGGALITKKTKVSDSGIKPQRKECIPSSAHTVPWTERGGKDTASCEADLIEPRHRERECEGHKQQTNAQTTCHVAPAITSAHHGADELETTARTNETKNSKVWNRCPRELCKMLFHLK